MFCVLGNITFQALGSPEVLDSSSASSYAEHKTVESMPRLQWVGEELEELSLDIMLHVSFSNPAADLAQLQAARKAHQAMALVFGNGYHAGYFVITKLSKSPKQLAADGSIIAIELKLQLKQWAQSIEVDPTAPPQPASTPPGMIVGNLKPGQQVAGAVNPVTGVVTFPATQAGVSAAVISPQEAAVLGGADPNAVPTAAITRMDPSVGAVLT